MSHFFAHLYLEVSAQVRMQLVDMGEEDLSASIDMREGGLHAKGIDRELSRRVGETF